MTLSHLSHLCQQIDTMRVKIQMKSKQSMSWIKSRREKLDLTQEELAARLQLQGIEASRSAVSAWEIGRNTPQFNEPTVLVAFARALKLSETEVLKLAGYNTQTTHSAQGERAAYIVDQMPDDRRDLAIKILEQLLT